ncbi:MAG: YdiU family protein, partial [Burkholderiales bacterium]|nr:YdiU family protein [Burkholderiales bacterium]
ELPQAGVPWPPATAPAPRLLFWNAELAAELGLQPGPGDDLAALFSGNALLPGSKPFAQAYAGHQFGGFSPSLGDGRALLLGECVDPQGRLRDLAFKGSGRTPFSRGGDGKAAVGPMLREVLVSEGLHALGVPCTRALAVVDTGDEVIREQVLPGAVLTRVASSHLRVGSFQYFAARGDLDNLRRLAIHAMARHGGNSPLELLRGVAQRQARLIAQWMNLGFIHGVMNTDNMTLSGESIDFGPCAFMEAYDPATKFSSIDHQGRYAYRNQPLIARWNLARLAESLLPLLADPDGPQADMDAAVAQVTEVIDAFPAWYEAALREGQRVKLGLPAPGAADAALASALADEWLALLQQGQADFTLAWRRLADALEGQEAALHSLFMDSTGLAPWLQRWRAACTASPAELRAANPLVIPRNHRVEEALSAASDDGDLRPTEQLLAALRQPFDEGADARYTQPAPVGQAAGYRTFCGT